MNINMNMLIALKIFVSCFLIIFLIIYTVCYFCYRSHSGNEAVKMKYKEFKTIYPLNPDRWAWKAPYCSDTRIFKYQAKTECVNILFNYITYFRVCLFFMSKNCKDKAQTQTTNQSKKMKLILQTAQHDIDKLLSQSEKEIKTAKTITENIGKKTNLWR